MKWERFPWRMIHNPSGGSALDLSSEKRDYIPCQYKSTSQFPIGNRWPSTFFFKMFCTPPTPPFFSLFFFPNRDGDLLGIQNILWKGSASTSQEARDSPEICIVHHISDCMVSEGWKGEGRTCLGKIWETKQVLESDRVNSGDMREKFLPRA